MAGGKLETDRDPVKRDPAAVPRASGLSQGSRDHTSGCDATGKFLKLFSLHCGKRTGEGAGREKNVLGRRSSSKVGQT